MVEVRESDFSADEAISRVKKPGVGGIVVYVGTVRSFSAEKQVESLEFAVDDETVRQRLSQIEEEARRNFAIGDVVLIHRVGTLAVSENILLIVIAAAHREPAFAACNYIIDNIKLAHSTWVKERVKEAKWS